jgi:hypothetical protein
VNGEEAGWYYCDECRAKYPNLIEAIEQNEIAFNGYDEYGDPLIRILKK